MFLLETQGSSSFHKPSPGPCQFPNTCLQSPISVLSCTAINVFLLNPLHNKIAMRYSLLCTVLLCHCLYLSVLTLHVILIFSRWLCQCMLIGIYFLIQFLSSTLNFKTLHVPFIAHSCWIFSLHMHNSQPVLNCHAYFLAYSLLQIWVLFIYSYKISYESAPIILLNPTSLYHTAVWIHITPHKLFIISSPSYPVFLLSSYP
jgi:hypothetical protein